MDRYVLRRSPGLLVYWKEGSGEGEKGELLVL